MKLELKHLAPYLPYGLKYATLSDDDDKYYIHSKHNTIGVGGNQSNVTNICLVEYSKPLYKIILRPLSDLTKEIKHNGEKFIPINKLKHLYGWDYLWHEVLGEITNFNVKKLKYACLILLLEWHFDVFGLIEQGLGIDINTLNK